MDYKKSHRILWICLIGALALSIINCVLAYVNESAAIVGIAVAVLVAAAGIIQAIKFFRCPYCVESVMSLAEASLVLTIALAKA